MYKILIKWYVTTFFTRSSNFVLKCPFAIESHSYANDFRDIRESLWNSNKSVRSLWRIMIIRLFGFLEDFDWSVIRFKCNSYIFIARESDGFAKYYFNTDFFFRRRKNVCSDVFMCVSRIFLLWRENLKTTRNVCDLEKTVNKFDGETHHRVQLNKIQPLWKKKEISSRRLYCLEK